MESFGIWAPVYFVGLQIIQVVIFVIPGEIVQVAGGYLFGVVWGSTLSLIGIAVGALIDFGVARALGRRFVVDLFGPLRLEKIDGLLNSPKGLGALFLLFLIPGLPKDSLCFVGGLSRIRLLPFLAISMSARLPGIIGSVVMGDALSAGRRVLFIVIAVVASILFILGILFKDRVHALIGRISSHGTREPVPHDASNDASKDEVKLTQ